MASATFDLPAWLESEMRQVAEIEPPHFLSGSVLESMSTWQPMRFQSAIVPWFQILNELGGGQFSHIFLLPWLKRGGADLEALHQIRVLTTQFDARVLAILTEDTDSPWLRHLP